MSLPEIADPYEGVPPEGLLADEELDDVTGGIESPLIAPGPTVDCM